MLKLFLLVLLQLFVFFQSGEIRDFYDGFLQYSLGFLNILICAQSFQTFRAAQIQQIRRLCLGFFITSGLFFIVRLGYFATGAIWIYKIIPTLYIPFYLVLFYWLVNYEYTFKEEKTRLREKRAAVKQKERFYDLKLDQLEQLSERAADFITEQPNTRRRRKDLSH